MSDVPGAVAFTLSTLKPSGDSMASSAERAALGWRDGRAVDQDLEIGDGIGSGHGCGIIQR